MVLNLAKIGILRTVVLLVFVSMGGCTFLDNRYEVEPEYDLGKPKKLRALPSIFAPPENTAKTNPAVESLIQTAREQAHLGKLSLGLATLERALAIEPDNARIWTEMARIHFNQGEWMQTIELARRSNQLAKASTSIKKENWV
ncbi:MAG TPA: hypothetical protein DCZ03_16360, partial [Gammaproteobacteria bacterium]|nr:hypothetical protein [Gammaproteobacteria bacterium]